MCDAEDKVNVHVYSEVYNERKWHKMCITEMAHLAMTATSGIPTSALVADVLASKMVTIKNNVQIRVQHRMKISTICIEK